METSIVNETQLMAEIERLREQFSNTQDLYREVCTLLFFRYGTTPTANKLYQLVRKGSMSAPAEALSKFWMELREKSRTRIEHPDLPEPLKVAAGDLAAAIWSSAQEQANQNLASYRHEADLVTAEARNALATAVAERDSAQAMLMQHQKNLADQQARMGELEQALAAENATTAGLEKQLFQANVANEALQDRLEMARHEFGEQLEQLRTLASQAEERSQVAEKRALLEIERERQAAFRLQKELEGSRAALARAGERHRIDADGLQTQIGNLRQQLGAVEGKLHETTEAKKELADEVKGLTNRGQELAAHAVALRSELQNWRTRAEKAESAIQVQLQEKAVKRPKKGQKPL